MKLARIAGVFTACAIGVAGPAPLSGCASTPAEQSGGVATMNQLTGEWVVTEIAGAAVTSNATRRGAPTMTITPDGKVSGFSGVNRYSTTMDAAALASGNLTLRPAAMTRMAGSPEDMQLETSFTEALGKVTSYSLQDDNLTLMDSARGKLLRLAKVKAGSKP
jgi:heat shock protein HslJ